MHYAVIKKDLKGGFNIYNWHDDTDDMTDVSGQELIGYVSKDGIIDAPYETDEIAYDGVIQALKQLGFNEKANAIRMLDTTTSHSSKNTNSDVITQLKEELLERMQDIAGYTDDDIFLGEYRAYKGILDFIQKIEEENISNK